MEKLKRKRAAESAVAATVVGEEAIRSNIGESAATAEIEQLDADRKSAEADANPIKVAQEVVSERHEVGEEEGREKTELEAVEEIEALSAGIYFSL